MAKVAKSDDWKAEAIMLRRKLRGQINHWASFMTLLEDKEYEEMEEMIHRRIRKLREFFRELEAKQRGS